jgi:hypothetical protein
MDTPEKTQSAPSLATRVAMGESLFNDRMIDLNKEFDASLKKLSLNQDNLSSSAKARLNAIRADFDTKYSKLMIDTNHRFDLQQSENMRNLASLKTISENVAFLRARLDFIAEQLSGPEREMGVDPSADGEGDEYFDGLSGGLEGLALDDGLDQ